MRILMYGAGAIGSIFAGQIAKAGYDVTMLARNTRYRELKENGLILTDSITKKVEVLSIPVIDSLAENDIYDYVFAVVQNTQIDSILPVLAKNRSANIVFVVNNPSGYQKYIDSVGYERVMIGFPSAGGERKDGAVNYFIGTGITKVFQSTTFGELSGEKTERLLNLIKIFKKAGFSPEISKNMDAWQKTHVAVILPIGKALYRFDSDNYRLARSYKTVKKMILATRECFKVLNKLNIRITPVKLKFYYLPVFILAPVFMIIMNTRIAEYSMAKHTIAAKDEMDELEKLFREFIRKSDVSTPALDWLSSRV
ncbi:MAG: ketopantoate reductase family protein [Spirochaetae bacterium HGW-Spirochaetae-5]|nr:MAG: ketopantoate reductase family protein [Spirochaetae bacterium HGW-Spirochaetae-5]